MTTYRRVLVSDICGVSVVNFKEHKILEAANIQELGDELVALVVHDGKINLVLDFDDVTFLSSAVLNKFVILSSKVRAKNGQLLLCNMVPEIHEVFMITRLNQLFEIFDTREKALAKMQSPAMV